MPFRSLLPPKSLRTTPGGHSSSSSKNRKVLVERRGAEREGRLMRLSIPIGKAIAPWKIVAQRRACAGRHRPRHGDLHPLRHHLFPGREARLRQTELSLNEALPILLVDPGKKPPSRDAAVQRNGVSYPIRSILKRFRPRRRYGIVCLMDSPSFPTGGSAPDARAAEPAAARPAPDVVRRPDRSPAPRPLRPLANAPPAAPVRAVRSAATGLGYNLR